VRLDDPSLRVHGRRFTDHLRWHVHTGRVPKDVPQVECPLCLAELRPKKKGDGLRQRAPRPVEQFARTQQKNREDVIAWRANGRALEPHVGLSYGDLAGAKVLEVPRRISRPAPFRNEKELFRWMQENFSEVFSSPATWCDQDEKRYYYDAPKGFDRAVTWLEIGRRYFLHGWSVHDIVNDNPTKWTEKAVERQVAEMRKHPAWVPAMGNCRKGT